MPLAVVLILLVVGSILFHLLSPWTFTPLASNWGMVDVTVDITLWVTGVVFIAVNLFMAVCVIKFRAKKGQRAKYEPENKKLESWLTILTSVGVAAMLTPGLVVWGKFVNVPEEAHEVEAVGQQWHWTYRFPGADGKFGDVKAELITMDNPFGMVPEDPRGQDDVLVFNPEVTIPVDKPVKFLLRSKDVLHNYTVAQFRVKMDLIPGMQTYLWLTPTETGRFEVLCEELCGIAHHTMRGAVVVAEQGEFDTWLAGYPTYADTLNRKAGDANLGRAQYGVCAACHGQNGEGLQALNAPKLSGQSEWYLRNQIRAYQNGFPRGPRRRHLWQTNGAHGEYARDRRGDQQRHRAYSLVPGRACAEDGRGQCAKRRTTVPGLRVLPRRGRRGYPVDKCATHGRNDRLVSRTATAEFQGWRARFAYQRLLRNADGFHGPHARRRPGYQ